MTTDPSVARSPVSFDTTIPNSRFPAVCPNRVSKTGK